jgi:hypothetical protein
MEKDKLSAREAALVAQARREAEARKGGARAAGPQAVPPSTRRPEAPDRPALSPAERLAQLMAEERAETERRKKKMRRYGLIVSGAILAAFLLWLMRAFSRRR